MKRVVAVVLIGMCASSFAQGLFAPHPSVGPGMFGSLSAPYSSAWSGQTFSMATMFNVVGHNPAFLQPVPAAPSDVAAATRGSDGKDLASRLSEYRVSDVYVGGEIGGTYGVTTGKYGGDFYNGYIMGVVGNDHLSIAVGAAYQESSERFPRRWR